MSTVLDKPTVTERGGGDPPKFLHCFPGGGLVAVCGKVRDENAARGCVNFPPAGVEPCVVCLLMQDQCDGIIRD